ncbi:MAG: hypothetical protein KAU84_03305, partial [Thermoplasmatales archaeon]|nr:hypothetical protein [Thermoplasmatales archaeon]
TGDMCIGIEASYAFISFEYDLKYFWWDNPEKLPFGNSKDDPWNDLHEFTIGLRYGGPVKDDWSYFALARISSAFEKDMDDSFGCHIGGGVIYEPSPEWQFRGGVLSNSR